MLNSEFDEVGDAGSDLYPAELRADIDEINAFVYVAVNNGVLYEGLAVKQVKFLCSAEGRFLRPGQRNSVRRAQKRSGLAGGHRREAAWS